MTWRVVVTRDRQVENGDSGRMLTVQELAYAAAECPTEAEALALAARIRNANHDPTVDVAVEPPAGHRPPPAPTRLDARTRTAGRQGLARARAQLRGEP